MNAVPRFAKGTQQKLVIDVVSNVLTDNITPLMCAAAEAV
jgi:hypothetical protein